MVEPRSEAFAVFGERVRAARQLAGVSQEDVAVLAEMHVTNVGKIERGLANPSLTTIVRIADALEIDPGKLIEGLNRDQIPGVTHRLRASDLVEARRAAER